jgi:hypothetical protein
MSGDVGLHGPAKWQSTNDDDDASKLSCLRIGSRYNCSCAQISTGDGTIEWCKEIMYLGISILSGKHFKCNFDQARINFYRSVNSIFNKIGQCSSPRVILSFLSSYCLPALMYGMEVVPISIQDML